MHCSVNDKCIQHVESSVFSPKNCDEEPSEEEMDTSEAVWNWFYLAECGVWHMFQVLDIPISPSLSYVLLKDTRLSGKRHSPFHD